MKFTSISNDTMQADLDAGEIVSILAMHGVRQCTNGEVLEILVPIVLDAIHDQLGYELEYDGVNVDVRFNDVGNIRLLIHGVYITDFDEKDKRPDGNTDAAPDAQPESEDAPAEAKPEDREAEAAVKAKFRQRNEDFTRGIPLPFDTMDEIVDFCHRVPLKKVQDSQLFRMPDRYYLVLKLLPICEEPGEQQNRDLQEYTRLTLTVQEFVRIPARDNESLDVISEHGRAILKTNAVGFLAGITPVRSRDYDSYYEAKGA